MFSPEKIIDLQTLNAVEEYILVHGPFGEPKSDPHSQKMDTVMNTALTLVMDKYTYGWDIEKQSFDRQIESICNFKIFILRQKEDHRE